MATTVDIEAVARRVLGWDLRTTPSEPGDIARDLVLTAPAGMPRDLALVAGADNLAQALTLALTTARGSSVFDTGYGFDGLLALVEESSGALVRERMRVAVAQTVGRDPRVRRIRDVQLASDGPTRTLEVRADVESVLGVVPSVTTRMP